MNNKNYAVLHTHDTYGSIGDAILKIKDYVAKAESIGIKSLAITNHGSMSTFINFYETCKQYNINPIIGCEIYFCNDRLQHNKENKSYNHLVLLAKNYNGLKNLIAIHNHAQEEGFYYKPRADWELLRKYHEDIICLTACLASPLAKPVLSEDNHDVNTVLTKLKSIFGDDLYLEIQPGNFEEQIKYNETLMFLSHSYKVKLVATNDIHYLNKDDWSIHDVHVKDARKIDDDKMIYPDKVYYLMDKKELLDSFPVSEYLDKKIISTAIENTNEVAKKCNLIIPKIDVMPSYSSKIDEYAILRSICTYNLFDFFRKVKYKVNEQEYVDRLSFELSTIKKLGFSGYFLIVKDIIDFCDNNEIARGPGRGSAAGSLVSFLLNISIADPIKYGLMFERFLSVNRKSLPDIDLDIDGERKEEVYKHLKDRYGKNHCCFVRTYGMRKARAAVKSAARIIGIAPQKANEISQLIPYIVYDKNGSKHQDVTITEALNLIPAFKEEAVKYPRLIDLSKQMEGYPFSTGIHPAGVVISPLDISKIYPLVPCKNDCFMATSLDLHDVEKLSGVKFDLLSLSSLSVINKTMKMINLKFDYTDEDILSDEKVWKLIGSSDTTGLFQISSKIYKSRMPKLKPKNIKDLAACLALVRGPCISSGADKKYMEIVNKHRVPEQLDPVYWEATKDTYGIVIYQEQILKICINVGFDSETAYKILKAVSKKKMSLIKSYKNDFLKLAAQKNIDDSIANKIWQEIENSGLYAFNIAHATSYALLCYLSAYLMTYYPKEYLCNLFTKIYMNNIKVNTALTDVIEICKKRKINIKPPDMNSTWDFSIDDDKIKMGFCSIKGIGEECYKEIHKNRVYDSLKDFVANVSGRRVNKKNMLILIAAGIFGPEITDNAKSYYELRKEKSYDGLIKINTETKINIFKDSKKKIGKALFTANLF